MIVTAASGYVAGTYLSTAAITAIWTTAAATLGTGALFVSGVAARVIGSAGSFRTTTGAPISIANPPATPVAGLITAGAAIVGCGYIGYRILKMRRKLSSVPEGAEAQFTETEANLIEQVIKRLSKKGTINE